MMESITRHTTTETNLNPWRRLVKGVAATLGAAFLLLSVACGASAPESPPQVIEREVIREVETTSQMDAQSQPAAPAQQSRPASVPSQSQSSAPAAQSQPAAESAPQAPASQGVQSDQSDSSGTAPRQAPRTVPRDTASVGPQPMVSAAQDPVSTFSLDTDRASYQRSLELAQSGYDIEPADVRAEEWINSLGYGYPRPSRSDEFAVHSDVFQHPDTQGMHMARIGIQAPDAQERRPVNVTLVLDSSGSMRDGNRVEIARQAAYAILDNLTSRDRIAVIHFEENVIRNKTVTHSAPTNRDVSRSLDRLDPGGATNVQQGLDAGLEMAYQARAQSPDAINYVILFSDGVANVDATNPFAILHNLGEASEYSRPNPIRIVTIGVGIQGYNDHLLEQIAQYGNGWYRYLDDPSQARGTFSGGNWTRLTSPFADQARAQVTWDPELVSHWRIVGYENRVTADSTFTQNLREFAEIPAGTATTVLYELQLTPRVAERQAATARLAEIEIRWVEPVTGLSREQYDIVSGAWREGFTALQDNMLRLGVVAGLSADIYASLDDGGYGTGGQDAPYRLTILADELYALKPAVGHLDAYWDIELLLQRLEQQAPRYAQTQPRGRSGPGAPAAGTGYSP